MGAHLESRDVRLLWSPPTDNFRFEASLGRVIGTAGETRMRIIIYPSKNEIVTAFPIKDSDVTIPGI